MDDGWRTGFRVGITLEKQVLIHNGINGTRLRSADCREAEAEDCALE